MLKSIYPLIQEKFNEDIDSDLDNYVTLGHDKCNKRLVKAVEKALHEAKIEYEGCFEEIHDMLEMYSSEKSMAYA